MKDGNIRRGIFGQRTGCRPATDISSDISSRLPPPNPSTSSLEATPFPARHALMNNNLFLCVVYHSTKRTKTHNSSSQTLAASSSEAIHHIALLMRLARRFSSSLNTKARRQCPSARCLHTSTGACPPVASRVAVARFAAMGRMFPATLACEEAALRAAVTKETRLPARHLCQARPHPQPKVTTLGC